jgi:hypothetical protein
LVGFENAERCFAFVDDVKHLSMNLDAVPQFSCAAGVSSGPVVEAIAPKVLWAIDFQFDSTTDGKVIKSRR